MHVSSSSQGPPEGRAEAANAIRVVKVLEDVLGRIRPHPSHLSAYLGLLSSYCVPGPVFGFGMFRRGPAAVELTFQSGEAATTPANKATEEALLESDKRYRGKKMLICWEMTA